MKNLWIPALVFILSQAVIVQAQDRHQGGGGGNGYSGGQSAKDNGTVVAPGRGKASKASKGNRNVGHNRGAGVGGSQNRHHFNNNGSGVSNRNVGVGSNGNVNNGTVHHFNQSNTSASGFHNNSASNARAFNSRAVPANIRKIGVKSMPAPFHESSKIMQTDRARSSISYPSVDAHGAAIHASVLAPRAMTSASVRANMYSVTGNVSFRAQIGSFNNSELRHNNYYWHTWNGMNYCHYYDNWGFHWYGWYLGNSCFWTRYWGGNWWWYDPAYYRWCYWHDGGWWWQDPYHLDLVYVYNNDQYVPVNGGYTGNNPNNDAGPVVAGPINDTGSISFQSKDGTREVKIVAGDAFLYDTVAGETGNKPVYLASNVKSVKFSNAQNGKPLQIMVELNDGSFDLYDADGNPSGGGAANNGGTTTP